MVLKYITGIQQLQNLHMPYPITLTIPIAPKVKLLAEKMAGSYDVGATCSQNEKPKVEKPVPEDGKSTPI
jgi:hypothetical protein